MAAKRACSGRAIPSDGGMIAVRLNELGQLFNTMDPAPFHEKELNRGAEAYILSCAKEVPKRVPLVLVVHLDQSAEGLDDGSVLREAVQTHFARRSQASQRGLLRLLRQGRAGLAFGLACLAASVIAGQAIASLMDHPLVTLLRESLVIGGWVAMWRPLETFLYDCWPMLGERRVYLRLSRMAVRTVYAADSISTGPLTVRHQYTSWGV